jgi:hypothetical protein
MRKATFASLVFVVCGYAASAQFTLTPKTGIEQSFTSVGYNNQSNFSPLGSAVSPQFSVRLDYRFKNIHGPFAGVATNRSLVAYKFMDPETGRTDFKASRGDMQLRLEAGYMYSSPAIKLGKSKSTAPAAKAVAPASTQKRCGGYSYSRCGQYKQAAKQIAQPAVKKSESMNMRIQPFAGMAYIPNPQTAIKTTDAMYQYNAGNWNTALIAGTNFEVAKGTQRKFVVGVQYLRGMGNLGNETLVSAKESAAMTTQLKSKAAAWNISVGVPLSLSKKKTVVKQTTVTAPAVVPEVKKEEPKKSSCQKYRTSCGKWQ